MSNSIEAAFPERAAQIKAFKAALGSCGKELILVSGPPLTGKTSVVREVLAQIGNPVVYVDGRECASERDLFVTAAAKLGSGSASKLKGSAQDIVDEMLEDFASRVSDDVTTYFVIDNADRLVRGAASSGGVLAVLCRVADKARKPIRPILISEKRWDFFRQSVGFVQSHRVDFPAFSLSEIRAIVERDLPPSASASDRALWPHFLTAVAGAFKQSYSFTLPEFRLLCAPLWERYRSLDPKMDPSQRFQALKGGTSSPNLHPALALPLHAASLALANGTVWPVPKNVGAGERGRLDLDLPIHARVALLAAYVAARRRGRVGPGGKGGKGAGAKRKRKEILGQQEPQPFTLEELLAHFEAIAATALDNADDDDEAEEEGASGGQGGGAGAGAGAVEGLGKARDASAGSVLSQVAGLLAHGLIAACTLEPLDGPRYRSLVGDGLAERVATNLKIKLAQHIYCDT